MIHQKHPILTLIVLFLIPAWLHAQSVEEQDEDVLEFEPATRPAGEAAGADHERVESLIIEKTNTFREKQVIEPVQSDPDLTAAAEYFADYMARTDRYGHTADGRRPSQRAGRHGYEYCIVAENIAYQYRSTGFETATLAERFVQGWIDSPEHRENMANPHVTEIGVAVARSDQTGY